MDDGWQYSSHGSITFLAPHMQPETSNKAPSISKEHAAEEEDDPFLNQQACGTSLLLWFQPCAFMRFVKWTSMCLIKYQNMGLVMMWHRLILVIVQGCGKAYGQLEVWLSKVTP